MRVRVFNGDSRRQNRIEDSHAIIGDLFARLPRQRYKTKIIARLIFDDREDRPRISEIIDLPGIHGFAEVYTWMLRVFFCAAFDLPPFAVSCADATRPDAFAFGR